MAKGKIIQQGHKLEREQPVGSEVTQDERFMSVLRYIAWKRNVFFEYDVESDDTIRRAISFLESGGIPVWHRETDSLTLNEVAPQVLLNDGEPTFEDHHIWDGFDVVFLLHCEKIYHSPDICRHLLVTVANQEMHNKLPVVVMTHSGKIPDYRFTCEEFDRLQQRLLNQIV